MPDLRTDLEALRDEWESSRSDDAADFKQEMKETMLASAASRLTALLAKHATEPKEWRGPWKCEKCGLEYSHNLGEILIAHRQRHWLIPGTICTGTLVPYERRRGG